MAAYWPFMEKTRRKRYKTGQQNTAKGRRNLDQKRRFRKEVSLSLAEVDTLCRFSQGARPLERRLLGFFTLTLFSPPAKRGQ